MPDHRLNQTVIGEGTLLRGDLVVDSAALILGGFEGTISGRGQLTIGPTGRVKGTIDVVSVVLEGTFEGDLTAASLSITRSATVSGTVRAGLTTPRPFASGEPSAVIIEPSVSRTPRTLTPAAVVATDIEEALAGFERTLAEFTSRQPAPTGV